MLDARNFRCSELHSILESTCWYIGNTVSGMAGSDIVPPRGRPAKRRFLSSVCTHGSISASTVNRSVTGQSKSKLRKSAKKKIIKDAHVKFMPYLGETFLTRDHTRPKGALKRRRSRGGHKTEAYVSKALENPPNHPIGSQLFSGKKYLFLETHVYCVCLVLEKHTKGTRSRGTRAG